VVAIGEGAQRISTPPTPTPEHIFLLSRVLSLPAPRCLRDDPDEASRARCTRGPHDPSRSTPGPDRDGSAVSCRERPVSIAKSAAFCPEVALSPLRAPSNSATRSRRWSSLAPALFALERDRGPRDGAQTRSSFNAPRSSQCDAPFEALRPAATSAAFRSLIEPPRRSRAAASTPRCSGQRRLVLLGAITRLGGHAASASARRRWARPGLSRP